MIDVGLTTAGRFCWVDLAATDAERAKAFYAELFGWTACEQAANGGSFTRLQLSGQDVGSIFQLNRANLDHGVPSHWTPYIRVDDVHAAARRAEANGGTVIVRPFIISGIAQVALILDPIGAHFGLWQPIAEPADENAPG